MLLASCGKPAAGAGNEAAAAPRHSPTVSPSPAGLLPATEALTDRLVLTRTSAKAATSIAGTLLVINHGRRPINLNHGCRPKFEVVLMGARYQPQVAFTADCSARPFIIHTGLNPIRFTLFTTYLVCAARTHLISS